MPIKYSDLYFMPRFIFMAFFVVLGILATHVSFFEIVVGDVIPWLRFLEPYRLVISILELSILMHWMVDYYRAKTYSIVD